jgi:RNase adapter protein RapZ
MLSVTLVTGMSGAGRSTATRALEDVGWFVVDNLPPTLMINVVDYVLERTQSRKVALVADVRGGQLFDELRESLSIIKAAGHDLRVLFLEAGDEALVRRYESSRRPHPLQRDESLLGAVQRERELLRDLRAEADIVIDTSNFNVHELRRSIENSFGDDEHYALRATIMSFGFKYGIPVDADLVADMRFLPNPYWDPELKELTGLDAEVNDYVVGFPTAQDFLTIAMGCTGGKHRSVAMAENLSARLVKSGVEVRVVHRDLGRE